MLFGKLFIYAKKGKKEEKKIDPNGKTFFLYFFFKTTGKLDNLTRNKKVFDMKENLRLER